MKFKIAIVRNIRPKIRLAVYRALYNLNLFNLDGRHPRLSAPPARERHTRPLQQLVTRGFTLFQPSSPLKEISGNHTSLSQPMPNRKLQTGGKPSTWFPPGRLVEQSPSSGRIFNVTSQPEANQPEAYRPASKRGCHEAKWPAASQPQPATQPAS